MRLVNAANVEEVSALIFAQFTALALGAYMRVFVWMSLQYFLPLTYMQPIRCFYILSFPRAELQLLFFKAKFRPAHVSSPPFFRCSSADDVTDLKMNQGLYFVARYSQLVALILL